MANQEHLAILKHGSNVWNKWRDLNPDAHPDFQGADLSLGNFKGARLREANLYGVELSGADLTRAKLDRANLSEAKLRGTNLRKADLSYAKLRGADLSEAMLEGVQLYKADLLVANLSQAKLRGANLSEAMLGQANLKATDLREANLSGVFLREANLRGADLGEANLCGADLSEANLMGANLSGTDLSNANLRGADLRGAKFAGAKLVGLSVASVFGLGDEVAAAELGATILGNSDLSEAIGLENVVHDGPSQISTDTFVRSKGKIPEVFLRGCGLSDWEVEEVKLYNPDLSNGEVNKILYRMYDLRATQALQISPLFVSYSRADSSFVDRIGDSLTEKGIRYWRDVHEMKAGRLEKQIDRAIRQNPTVLLVLSEHSLSSDWVEHEVRTARGLEKEIGRDVLCPVALDDSWKNSPWPKRVMEQVMEYNILDFSAWKDDSKFGDIFRKLIDGLELFYKG